MQFRMRCTNPTTKYDAQKLFESDMYQINYHFCAEEIDIDQAVPISPLKGRCDIRVSMMKEISRAWRLDEADIYKVIFRFAQQYVTEKILKHDLKNKEDCYFSFECINRPCPFEIAKLSEPSDACFFVELSEE